MSGNKKLSFEGAEFVGKGYESFKDLEKEEGTGSRSKVKMTREQQSVFNSLLGVNLVLGELVINKQYRARQAEKGIGSNGIDPKKEARAVLDTLEVMSVVIKKLDAKKPQETRGCMEIWIANILSILSILKELSALRIDEDSAGYEAMYNVVAFAMSERGFGEKTDTITWSTQRKMISFIVAKGEVLQDKNDRATLAGLKAMLSKPLSKDNLEQDKQQVLQELDKCKENPLMVLIRNFLAVLNIFELVESVAPKTERVLSTVFSCSDSVPDKSVCGNGEVKTVSPTPA